MSVKKEQIEEYIMFASKELHNETWFNEISNYLRNMPTKETQFKTSDKFVVPTEEKITWVFHGYGGGSGNCEHKYEQD